MKLTTSWFRLARDSSGLVPVLILLTLLFAPAAVALNVATDAGTATNAPANAPELATTVGLSQLADILENDTERAKLIDTLRAAVSDKLKQSPAEPLTVASSNSDVDVEAHAAGNATSADDSGPLSEPTTAAEPQVLAIRRLAQTTSGWAENISANAAIMWQSVVALWSRPAAGQSVSAFDAGAFWNALIIFVLVVAATLLSLFILRLFAGGLFSALSAMSTSRERGLALIVRRGSAFVVAVIVDVAAVVLACGIGYAVGLLAVGHTGVIGARESLFINAFAVVELTKVAIRAVFSSRYDGLRLVRMPSSIAGWWSIRLRWFVGVIGYSLLVAVPIINAQLAPSLGALVSFLVMAGAYIYALTVIFKNRKLLTQRLLTRSENATLGFFAVLFSLSARLWVIVALIYFTTLFVASQVNPAGVLPFMLAATLKTLVAAAIALSLSGLLSRAIGKHFSVSERTRARLPLLENRINAYVPIGLKTVRVLILLAFVMVVANVWGVFNFSVWAASAGGSKTLSVIIHLLIVFIGAAALWIFLTSILEHRLSRGPGGGAPTPRQVTLLALIRNALAIVVITMTAMIALSQIGVNIGPLIAGAGVVGLAIGFGAQKLVSDVITGVFIQIENALNTGDWVNLAGVSGGVEKLTIRSVSLRALDGTLHVIPFSSTSVVSNYNRQFGYHVHSYRIAYREDIDDAIRHLRLAYEDLQKDDNVRPNLLDEMSIPGVTDLAENAVEIRVMIKTTAGMQWSVGRAFNRLVKMHFDAAGIEIPTAQRTLYFGRDKDGWSPPVRVRAVDTDRIPLQGDTDTSASLDTSGREADTPAWDGGQ